VAHNSTGHWSCMICWACGTGRQPAGSSTTSARHAARVM
jgi:hypothetical protein